MGPLDVRGREEEEKGRPAWGGSHRIRGAGNCPVFCPPGPEEPPVGPGLALHPLWPRLPLKPHPSHAKFFFFSFFLPFLVAVVTLFFRGILFFVFFFLLFSSGVQFYLPGVVKHISLFSLLFL